MSSTYTYTSARLIDTPQDAASAIGIRVARRRLELMVSVALCLRASGDMLGAGKL